MNDSENHSIDRLRDELHGYHEEVVGLVKGCEPCQKMLAKLSMDMYGINGKKETYPGIVAHVISLRRSRKVGWTLLTILLSALVAAALQAHFR